MRATNYAGSVDTNSLSVALASLPDKPSISPTSDASLTDTATLAVVIDLFTSVNDGGSEITLYDIQYDDGNRGTFTSVMQLAELLVISENIEQGAEYRVRYRAKNFNGWGTLSEISYILAATTPSKPDAPIYV